MTYSSVDNIIKALKSKTNENEFLETLTYEISFGTNKDNIYEHIGILESLFIKRPSLKNILENVIKNQMLFSQAKAQLAKHFNIEYSIDITNIYYNDDVQKFSNNNDIEYINRFFYVISDAKKRLRDKINDAIDYEAVNIFEFILQNIKKDYLLEIFFEFNCELLAQVIRCGNFQMINLLESLLEIDFEAVNQYDFIDSHNFNILVYGYEKYGHIYNTTSKTMSLLHHFLNDIELYKTVEEDYAISSLMNKYSKKIIIQSEAYNVIYERLPFIRFQFIDLEVAVMYHNYELAKIIINNFHFKNKHIKKIDKVMFVDAIESGNIELVKLIYNLNPKVLNETVESFYEANELKKVLLYSSNQPNLLEIIEFLTNKNEKYSKIFLDRKNSRHAHTESNTFVSILIQHINILRHH